MQRDRLAVILMAGSFLMLALPAFALESDNFTYSVSGDGTVTITGYTGRGGDVVIPSTLNGRTVVAIGAGAFVEYPDVTGVTIPAGVASVESFAFYRCSALRYCRFYGDAPLMWSSVFDGCAPGFTVYADSGTAGFSYPKWYGYRSSACTDADHDGYYSQGGTCGEADCNDDDFSVNPGAAELCNGIDDDCDGVPDDGLTFTYYYRDIDADGYGDPAQGGGVFACAQPEGYVDGAAGFDCNDNDRTVHPGGHDTNCNGIDEDCDNETDEGYEGVVTSCGIGACARTGRTVCPDGALEPVDTCLAGTPAAVDANCNGIDDDCDGTADDDYVTVPTSCGIGACVSEGVTLCVNGAVDNTCIPGRPSSDANCNGIDDDCDGTADEDYVSEPTSCGVGACAGSTGTTACVDGSVVDSCNPLAGATADSTCNGIDDDCDGIADDGYVPEVISCGIGACSATGQTYCAGGVVQSSCTAGRPTSDANCDGIDNDCDGTADDDYVPEPATCGVGACAAAGETFCDGGTVREDCTAGSPSGETCNGIDDDCDGVIDNGMGLVTYHRDADADMYGNAFMPIEACDGPPAGYVQSPTADNGSVLFDCDDDDPLLHAGCVVPACNLKVAPRRIFKRLTFFDPIIPFSISANRESETVFAAPIEIDWGADGINDIIRTKIGPRVIIGFLMVRPLRLETGEYAVTVTFGEDGTCTGMIVVQ